MSEKDAQSVLRSLLTTVCTSARLAVLFEIGSRTPSEIAKEVSVEPSAISQNLKVLEEAGLVTSIKRQYSLTENGKKLRDSLSGLVPIAAEIEREKQAKALLREQLRKHLEERVGPEVKKTISRFGAGLNEKDIAEILREIGEA